MIADDGFMLLVVGRMPAARLDVGIARLPLVHRSLRY
jgi:hypothetical protein